MPSNSSPLHSGQLFQTRYRIIQIIGLGGMSTVYLAHDERLTNKKWAIKESTTSKQHTQQLRNEASILAALQHPYLPSVADFYPSHHNGRAYLIMEYIEGNTIADILQKQALSFKETMNIVISVCEVIAYLHAQIPAIIFRDVKPSNIMISTQGFVKLIDFGIATNINLLADQRIKKLGTIGFAAPEQYDGQQMDARTDLYGIGVLIGYMLTNGRWRGRHSLTPAMLIQDAPKEIMFILSKLLHMYPQKRFQTINELLIELLYIIDVLNMEKKSIM